MVPHEARRGARRQRRTGCQGRGVRLEHCSIRRDAARRPAVPTITTIGWASAYVIGAGDLVVMLAIEPVRHRYRRPRKECGHVDGLAHRRGGRSDFGGSAARPWRLTVNRGRVRHGQSSAGLAHPPREHRVDRRRRCSVDGRDRAEAANSIWSAGCSLREPSLPVARTSGRMVGGVHRRAAQRSRRVGMAGRTNWPWSARLRGAGAAVARRRPERFVGAIVGPPVSGSSPTRSSRRCG